MLMLELDNKELIVGSNTSHISILHFKKRALHRQWLLHFLMIPFRIVHGTSATLCSGVRLGLGMRFQLRQVYLL